MPKVSNCSNRTFLLWASRKVLLSHFNSLLPTSFSNRDRGLTTCGPTYFTTSSFFYCVPEKAINEVGILAIALSTRASFTTSQCIKITQKSLIFQNCERSEQFGAKIKIFTNFGAKIQMRLFLVIFEQCVFFPLELK